MSECLTRMLTQILDTCLSPLGQLVGQPTTEGISSPEGPLARKPKEVSVKGPSVRQRPKPDTDFIRRQKAAALSEDFQDF